MKTITIYGCPIPYDIHQVKNRRTIQITLTPEGNIQLKTPYTLTKAEAEQILANKADWIQRQRHRLHNLSTNPVNGKIAPDVPLLYLGQCYRLKIAESLQDQVFIDGDYLVVYYRPTQRPGLAAAQALLLKWYVEQATAALLSRTNYWAKQIGVSPARITIRDQKTRWGSCSSRGSINYSWRLIMAPSLVLDYLVIHELCHMKVANHSREFWKLVGCFITDYTSQRHWLKENGNLLMRLFTNG